MHEFITFGENDNLLAVFYLYPENLRPTHTVTCLCFDMKGH